MRRRQTTVDPTQHIAAEMRRLRTERGWSARELSERCAAAGLDLKRTVISNLESGYRTTVTAHELVVLAAIFGVTVMSLISGGPCCESHRIVRQVRGVISEAAP